LILLLIVTLHTPPHRFVRRIFHRGIFALHGCLLVDALYTIPSTIGAHRVRLHITPSTNIRTWRSQQHNTDFLTWLHFTLLVLQFSQLYDGRGRRIPEPLFAWPSEGARGGVAAVVGGEGAGAAMSFLLLVKFHYTAGALENEDDKSGYESNFAMRRSYEESQSVTV
jgi:hypothetical protein